MPFSKRDRSRGCPRTGQTNSPNFRSRLLRWLFPLTGLLALIWFLIRVIPKPSRATYPCQRAAFPLASGFVVWLLGLAGSAAACRRASRLFARAQYVAAGICVMVAVSFAWMTLVTDARSANAPPASDPPVANEPIGEAKGIHPGRVAWIHDAKAATWPGDDGITTKPYWHSDACTNPQEVEKMLSEALRTLTGASSDYAAWDALFRNFNEQMGRGNRGYQPGEKIGIKTNFVVMNNSNNGVKSQDRMDQIDSSPQLAIALLTQLTEIAGVEPNKISIGDPSQVMPNYWYNMVEPNCPGVLYLSRGDVSLPGRTKMTFDNTAPFYWSDPDPSHFQGVKKQDYIPTQFSQARYFINFAVLKSHTQNGITVTAKNHYGSLRLPTASGYYNMHWTRAWETPGMGHYRALVDLIGHPKLGGKTLLFMIDGLYGGRGWDARPIRWKMPPFNNQWPASIFLSQDPVAIDSVAYDFLRSEWNTYYPGAGQYDTINLNGYPQMSGTEDYLHEAALVPNPPSGTVYDPNHDGGLTQSLGVHEHWNNSIDKQYSRNLDPNGTGIELATELGLVGDIDDNNDIDANDYAILTDMMGSRAGDPDWNPACDISMPSDGVIDEADYDVFVDQWIRHKQITDGRLVGDFDNDRDVDVNDYAILAAAMGSQPGDPNWNPACDISIPSDNVIDEADFDIFFQQLTAHAASSEAREMSPDFDVRQAPLLGPRRICLLPA